MEERGFALRNLRLFLMELSTLSCCLKNKAFVGIGLSSLRVNRVLVIDEEKRRYRVIVLR